MPALETVIVMTSGGEKKEKLELLSVVWEPGKDAAFTAPSTQSGSFLKISKAELLHDPATLFLRIYCKKNEVRESESLNSTHVHSGIIHNNPEME